MTRVIETGRQSAGSTANKKAVMERSTDGYDQAVDASPVHLVMYGFRGQTIIRGRSARGGDNSGQHHPMENIHRVLKRSTTPVLKENM